MATINTNTNEKIVSIKKWYGMNEAPDGDTKLKYGEAAVMQNFIITRDGNLCRRPGQVRKVDLGTYTLQTSEPSDWEDNYTSYYKVVSGEYVKVTGDEAPAWASNTYYTRTADKVKCLWCGNVADNEIVLAACNGHLYQVFYGSWSKTDLGSINTDNQVFIFGYSKKAYIMNGVKYYSYDGTTLAEVVGYRPLVVTACTPAGAGTTLEQVNKLNGLRRVRYTPDGTSTEYVFPDFLAGSVISSVDKVTVDGTATSAYTADLANGKITFTTAPSGVANSVEIWYTVNENARSEVEGMHFAELFNGATDNRVFIYGDGSNECFYSGLTEQGDPSAEYFPDMNECAVGESNTEITALIRHSTRLICYKSNSTYSLTAGTYTDTDGNTMVGFTVLPINRSIGNVAKGQAQLVLNYPRTLFGHEVYEWKNSSSYSSMLTADERQAKRISDRVQNSIQGFNLADTICFDDNANQQYLIAYNGKVLVHNYVADAWYYLNNFYACSFCSMQGELYFGTNDGEVRWYTDTAKTDCGEAIEAYWESGAMDFGAEWKRKYTSAIWVSIKPETNSYLEVSAITDKKSDFTAKTIARGTTGFPTWDFRSFSFNDNTQPQIKKLRLKAKKYVYYKIIFQNEEPNTVATILAIDLKVRETSFSK